MIKAAAGFDLHMPSEIFRSKIIIYYQIFIISERSTSVPRLHLLQRVERWSGRQLHTAPRSVERSKYALTCGNTMCICYRSTPLQDQCSVSICYRSKIGGAMSPTNRANAVIFI